MQIKPFKIAAICTAYWPASHADVIVTRWLRPFASDLAYGWQPRTQIASLHILQTQPVDGTDQLDWKPAQRAFSPGVEIGRPLAARHSIPLFDSVRDALTLDSDTLSVDAVLIIGEHGDFPYNAYGQHLYPRKALFDEVVAVFKTAQRVAPVFVDKHLSWNGAWAREMVQTAHAMRIPLMAGSSLPHTLTLKPALPAAADIAEGVAVFYVGPEVYGFHSLEGMQAILENRPGGERGIRAITAFTGEGVWQALDNGAWSRTLFDAAVAAAHKSDGDMRANCRGSDQHGASPAAFLIERVDGIREAHINLQGHIQDFALAVRTRSGEIYANRWECGDFDDFFHHFAVLDVAIQDLFVHGRAPIPIERTLLTSCAIEQCMHALSEPGRRLETPDLAMAYAPR